MKIRQYLANGRQKLIDKQWLATWVWFMFKKLKLWRAGRKRPLYSVDPVRLLIWMDIGLGRDWHEINIKDGTCMAIRRVGHTANLMTETKQADRIAIRAAFPVINYFLDEFPAPTVFPYKEGDNVKKPWKYPAVTDAQVDEILELTEADYKNAYCKIK